MFRLAFTIITALQNEALWSAGSSPSLTYAITAQRALQTKKTTTCTRTHLSCRGLLPDTLVITTFPDYCNCTT
ncbi:hypothetical protein PF005_g19584 [Phytophthora fragariae]|uniref:Secreted protein n=1 Tax=Phytophthora fragariae TaxID=53985 RepID=A0A6A3WXN2_9STRA|nr:hypothetical protein PF003_g8823 [Phytophthora fragariae]KAE8940455.1 hypothetical protein PF009_g9736 [Phytophthora fragariae]KAE9090660.1 hypothetical protein PF007_g19159 [Phytophthora fragariae]KAE9118977.1 hypothetical protein PF006_g18459 [Phytophthora fragariae]KAE9189574.1 hypothetical protein PF005_g19584 [Phytophthora fragariae]